MRLDEAGPRTWLLAAVAGWALLAWLLAAAGMGGRIERLERDPSLLKPIPPVRPAPPLRLGPLGQYSQIAARPLFAQDRKPHPFFLQGEGEVAEESGFDYVLTSVLITPKLKMAILQPVDTAPGMGAAADGSRSVRVKLDSAPESHPSWRLIGLSERSAVFAGPEGERTLQLRVYDGVGGSPPTVVQPDDAPADGAVPIRPPMAKTPGRDASSPAAEPTPATDPAEPAEQDPSRPLTEQEQMDAIRERIQDRREQMRRQQQSKPSPAEPVE